MLSRSLATLIFIICTGPCWATQLVYEPVNPSFGGNPLNGNFLLGQAESQNKHKDDKNSPIGSTAGYQRDPMAYFEESLVRRILNELANNIVESSFSSDGSSQIQDGHYQFGDYVIDIVNFGDVVSVSITDLGTGNSTIVEVPATVDLTP